MKKYSFNKKYLIQFCEEILISFILHIWLIRYAILLIIFFSYIFFNENSGFWILFWKYFVIFNVIYLLCNILLSIDNKLEIKNLEKRRKLDQEIEGVKIRGDKLKLDFLNQKISKTKNGFVNKYIPHFFKKKYYKDDGYGDWHRMLTKKTPEVDGGTQEFNSLAIFFIFIVTIIVEKTLFNFLMNLIF